VAAWLAQASSSEAAKAVLLKRSSERCDTDMCGSPGDA